MQQAQTLINSLTQAERDALVTEHMGMVYAIGGSYSRRLRSTSFYCDKEDIFQEGMIGLIHAARSFDPSKGIFFSVLARRRILGQIRDWLRSVDPMSRRQRQEHKAGEEVTGFVRVIGDFDAICGVQGDHTSARATERNVLFRQIVKKSAKFLTERERTVIQSNVLGDNSQTETAEELGLSQASVTQAKKRAIGKMRLIAGSRNRKKEFTAEELMEALKCA